MTIKDLAAKTGYAVGTVSRVLNNHPNVSEKARTAILAAVEESGFQLNLNAKQLKQTHATTILVIVKGTSNLFFAHMVEDIQNLLSGTRYPIHVDYMHGAENEVRRAIHLHKEKKALGVIFLGGNLDNFRSDFRELGIPGVLVTNNAEPLNMENLSSVFIDDRRASYQAVKSLLSLGHRHIAVVGGHRLYSDTSKMRWQGALDALSEAGVSIDPELDYCTVYFSPDGGCNAVNELMQRGRKPTAIFAMSDMMAIGVVRALRDFGLRVPEDVSVIGFDGLTMAGYMIPRITTVEQPWTAMARRSVELLLSVIENGSSACHEAVPFRILYRESTGPVQE